MKKQNQVGDYLFMNDEDAVLAAKEADKIQRLEEKIHEADVELLYKLYNKSIEKKVFCTPIGYAFMLKLKHKLDNSSDTPGEVLPIPLEHNFTTGEAFKSKREDAKSDEVEKNVKNPMLGWSLFTNVVLIILVIVMFWIVTTGDSPNVINYENAVLDKYAKWEQELDARENALREAGY